MFIYVIGPEIGPQKIGFTKDVNRRIKALQTGHPQKLIIHHLEEVNEKVYRKLEKRIHLELNYKKLKGEWFNMTSQEAVEFLQYAIIRWSEDALLLC